MDHYARVQRWVAALVVALAAILAPLVSLPARADDSSLRIDAGAEIRDHGIQAAFFFQSDVTVMQGSTVTWIFRTGEPHSVHFDDDTGSNSPLNSDLRTKGAPDFKMAFPRAGNYNYHCDIHGAMKGVVHVLEPGTGAVPTQAYYNQLSAHQKSQLLAEGRRLLDQNQNPGPGQVTAGVGIMHETDTHDAGEVYLLRFLKGKTTVHVGDTVTFTNRDPDAPHTITVNENYPDPFAAQNPDNLTTDPTALPGAATLPNNGNKLNSGWLMKALPPLPPFSRGPVFKVTFTKPGVYNYYCELHDTLGMVGQIQVVPKDK